MKKHLSKVLAIVLIVTTLCCMGLTLFACDKNQGSDVKSEVTIVLIDNVNGKDNVSYNIDLSEAGLKDTNSVEDLLTYIGTERKEKIHSVVSQSAYGAFLSEIGEFKPVDNQYIAVFTSNAKDKDVSEWALEPIEYKGTTLYYSGLGISSMKLEENAVYGFVLTTY